MALTIFALWLLANIFVKHHKHGNHAYLSSYSSQWPEHTSYVFFGNSWISRRISELFYFPCSKLIISRICQVSHCIKHSQIPWWIIFSWGPHLLEGAVFKNFVLHTSNTSKPNFQLVEQIRPHQNELLESRFHIGQSYHCFK